MSAAAKRYLSLLGFALSSSMLAIFAGTTLDWSIAVLPVNVVAWAYVIRRISCPNCGTPLFLTAEDYNQTPTFLRRFPSIRKETCHVCGWDLAKNP
jgi:hypothetical protein